MIHWVKCSSIVHGLCRLRFYISSDVAQLFINNVYSGKPYPFSNNISYTPHLWNHALREIDELELGLLCLYIPAGHAELLVAGAFSPRQGIAMPLS